MITGISLVTLIAVGSTAAYDLARKQSRLSYTGFLRALHRFVIKGFSSGLQG